MNVRRLDPFVGREAQRMFWIRVVLRRTAIAARLSALFFLAATLPYSARAQVNVTPSRITQAVNETNLTVVRGNTHPLGQARFDQGAALDALAAVRMLLVSKRSPDQ
jgi:hypothetical protein